MTSHFEIKPAEPNDEFLQTQASFTCCMCGNLIEMVGGPQRNALCGECADSLISGRYLAERRAMLAELGEPGDHLKQIKETLRQYSEDPIMKVRRELNRMLYYFKNGYSTESIEDSIQSISMAEAFVRLIEDTKILKKTDVANMSHGDVLVEFHTELARISIQFIPKTYELAVNLDMFEDDGSMIPYDLDIPFNPHTLDARLAPYF